MAGACDGGLPHQTGRLLHLAIHHICESFVCGLQSITIVDSVPRSPPNQCHRTCATWCVLHVPTKMFLNSIFGG